MVIKEIADVLSSLVIGSLVLYFYATTEDQHKSIYLAPLYVNPLIILQIMK